MISTTQYSLCDKLRIGLHMEESRISVTTDPPQSVSLWLHLLSSKESVVWNQFEWKSVWEEYTNWRQFGALPWLCQSWYFRVMIYAQEVKFLDWLPFQVSDFTCLCLILLFPRWDILGQLESTRSDKGGTKLLTNTYRISRGLSTIYIHAEIWSVDFSGRLMYGMW